MFLRLKTYLTLVAHEAAASALASTLRADNKRYLTYLHAERKEVKRLTNIIIHLKEGGQNLPPGHGDEVWGRYVMGEENAQREGHQEPTAGEREAAVNDADFHADLERALADEV